MHTNYSSEAFALITQFGTQTLVNLLVEKFKKKANKNEDVAVFVWKGNDLYIQVSNRTMAYPIKLRALITVDAATGMPKKAHVPDEHSFVRSGWRTFAAPLVGDSVSLLPG